MSSSVMVRWLDLHRTLKAALKFVLKDSLRLALNSVLISSDGSAVKVVSSNGRGLFVATLGGSGELTETLVSRVDVQRFLSLRHSTKCEDLCHVARCARKISFAADGSLMTFKPIEAQYPPYQVVIPKRPVKSPVGSIGIAAGYARDVTDAFRIMNCEAMKVSHGAKWSDPAVFTPGNKGTVSFKIVLMPMRLP